MKLVVGLGNPGREYDNTRHNMGFKVLDLLAKNYQELFKKEKFGGKYFIINENNEKVIFLKPQKYMNLSGEVVKEFISFFKIDIKDVIIVVDDLDLPTGKIRLRTHGSSGGHNGLKNIFNNLGTDNIKRIKIGIGNNKNIETKNYVLGNISQEEKNIINSAIIKVKDIIIESLNNDFDKLMSKYN